MQAGGEHCTLGLDTIWCIVRGILKGDDGSERVGYLRDVDGVVGVVESGGLVRVNGGGEGKWGDCVRIGGRVGWWGVKSGGGVGVVDGDGGLWGVEVECGSVGVGFCEDLLKGGGEFVGWRDAWVLGVLGVGARGRVRSCHGRVLEIVEEGEGVFVVVQGEGKGGVEVSGELEGVFDFVRWGKGGRVGRYCLKDVEGRGFLRIDGGRMVGGSVVSLVKDETVGVVEIGVRGNGEVSIAEVGGKFLMAGMFGKLEVRSRCRGWERWRIEVVKQALEAALKKVEVCEEWREAEAADKVRMRLEISKRVADARGKDSGQGDKQNRNGKGKAFNYTRALSGISETTNTASKTSNKSSQKSVWVPKSSSGASNMKVSKTAGPIERGGSKIPRSKSAKKRARKKAKKASAASAASKASSNALTKGAAKNVNGSENMNKESASEEKSKTSGSKEKASAETSEKSSENVATSMSGPPCAACGQPLIGRYTTALNKQWHPQCFRCRLCQIPMGGGGGKFRSKNNVPYCEPCYVTKVAERCAKCGKGIGDEVITAMEKTWHKDCLTCVICKLPLTKTFWIYPHKPREPRCSKCHIGDENYDGSHLFGRNRGAPLRNANKNASTLGSLGATTTIPPRFFGSQ